jgi:multicomponent Na+:H+ antiporter subunit G
MQIVGALLLFLAAFWFLISSLGIVRMPDFFTRIHAGAKASTLGFLLLVIGAGVLQPSWAPKLLAVGALLLLTNPIGASVLARAAYRSKEVPLSKVSRDDYGDYLQAQSHGIVGVESTNAHSGIAASEASEASEVKETSEACETKDVNTNDGVARQQQSPNKQEGPNES